MVVTKGEESEVETLKIIDLKASIGDKEILKGVNEVIIECFVYPA